MTDRYKFSEKLLNAMTKKGITQKELAKQMGLSKSSINNYLHGTIPSEDRLNLIAEILQISTDDLLS